MASKRPSSSCCTRMTEVAVAIETDRDSSPHRARQSSLARAMGSNGRRTGWLTPSTVVERTRRSPSGGSRRDGGRDHGIQQVTSRGVGDRRPTRQRELCHDRTIYQRSGANSEPRAPRPAWRAAPMRPSASRPCRATSRTSARRRWARPPPRSSRLELGHGNDGLHDGALQGHVLGTYVHGPVLARNADLADLFSAGRPALRRPPRRPRPPTPCAPSGLPRTGRTPVAGAGGSTAGPGDAHASHPGGRRPSPEPATGAVRPIAGRVAAPRAAWPPGCRATAPGAAGRPPAPPVRLAGREG